MLNSLEIFHRFFYSPFIYIFHHIFNQYEYLFYTLGFIYFVAYIIPALAFGISLSGLLCPFGISPSW